MANIKKKVRQGSGYRAFFDCDNCGKESSRPISRINGDKVFCSSSCNENAGMARHTEKHTEEAKEKMRENYNEKSKKTQFKQDHEKWDHPNVKKNWFDNGVEPWNKGKENVYDEKTIEKIRKARIEQDISKEKTSIEIKMQEYLDELSLNYQEQVSFCNITIVDFYLKEFDLIIYCDGDYWHSKKSVKKRDEKQNKILEDNGYRVLRFSGTEIREDKNKIINKIKQNINDKCLSS